MNDRISGGLTFAASMCAIVCTVLLVRREFFVPTPPDAEPAISQVKDWPSYTRGGQSIGDQDAVVTIVEFADFQCPACLKFAVKTCPAIHRMYGSKVRLVYRHFPLSYHDQAYDASKSAECASAQGRFEQMHDALFLAQDSIRHGKFQEFARTAGIPNIAEFDACMANKLPVPSIEADMKAFEQVGGRGTPTILANGFRFASPPDSARLSAFIDDQLRKFGAKD